jgi:hypothetical protein
MRQLISDSFVNTAIRVVIGAIFTYAGVVKMMDPWAFARAIDSFHMLPPAFISPVAIVLPTLEVIAGVLWLLNRVAVSAAVTILGLCLLFAVALGAAMARGLPVDCGCFGAAFGGSTPTVALLRDLFLLAATYYWLVITKPKTSNCP